MPGETLRATNIVQLTTIIIIVVGEVEFGWLIKAMKYSASELDFQMSARFASGRMSKTMVAKKMSIISTSTAGKRASHALF